MKDALQPSPDEVIWRNGRQSMLQMKWMPLPRSAAANLDDFPSSGSNFNGKWTSSSAASGLAVDIQKTMSGTSDHHTTTFQYCNELLPSQQPCTIEPAWNACGPTAAGQEVRSSLMHHCLGILLLLLRWTRLHSKSLFLD